MLVEVVNVKFMKLVLIISINYIETKSKPLDYSRVAAVFSWVLSSPTPRF